MAGGSQRQIRRIQLDALDLWILHHYVGFILFRIPHTFRSQNAIPGHHHHYRSKSTSAAMARSAYYDCLLVCLQACCSLRRRAHGYTFAVIPEPLSVGAESAADLPGRAPGGLNMNVFSTKFAAEVFIGTVTVCLYGAVWCAIHLASAMVVLRLRPALAC